MVVWESLLRLTPFTRTNTFPLLMVMKGLGPRREGGFPDGVAADDSLRDTRASHEFQDTLNMGAKDMRRG